MNRRSSLAFLFLIGLWFSSAHAQVATNPQASGQDYFTADRSGGSYLSIVEKNHVRTIPDWIKKGRLPDAIGDIKYTLDRFPNHPVSLQQLSMVAQITKNTALGVGYFERAVALFPQYALTRAQYGLFLVSINNIDAAIENLNQSIEMEPKLAAGYAGLAHAYAKKGDIERARIAAQKARELGFNGKLPDGL
jgi:tetratricopeptide (TPR) repeat protein